MSCDRVRACPSVDDTRTGSPPHKIERPSTAQSLQSKVKPQTQPKSFIPTFKSLSQPPSIAPMESPHKHDSLSKGMEEINSSLMDSELLTDINAISDEFKDCLESVKLDFDGENAELDTLHLGTAEEILNNLKTPDEIDSPPLRHGTKGRDTSPKQRILGRGSAPIRNLSRKNSSSGIPVSVSLANKVNNSKNATPRQQQLPRRGSLSPNGQSSTRRAATTVGSPEKTVPNPTVKRNLDIFLTKKRRYETLRKEIQTKQKPLVDLYNALSQMKKKLAELGEQVSIDPIPMIEESEVKPPVRTADVGISGEDSIEVINVDVHILDEVRKSADDLRANSVELCKNMMEKRNVLLSSFENIARLDQNSTLLHELELHRNENVALNNFLSKTIQEHENDLKDMIKKMSHLKIIPIPVSNPSQMQVQKQGTPPPPAEPLADYTKELQERTKELETSEAKIKQLEKKLSTVQNELKSTQAANAAGQENGESLRSENDKLKHKISVLEKLIDTEKRKAQHDVDRLKTTEISSKTLKGKIKELENAKAQNESKINTLNAEIRIAQSKLKTAEKNFEKELSEMNKSRNLDKAVIERLNRDKSTFETRMAELNQQAAEAHKEYTERDQRQRQEVETMRQELDVQTNTVHQLRLECEKLQNELNTIHIHAQQSSELLRKKDDGYALITERECELQIEVVAQRAAMKALQEKVDANAMEKIRFIETIENMNGSTNEMRDEIVKTLVQKEEEITQLHQHLKKRDDDLANRRIEVQNLKAKIDNLQEHIQAMKEDENEADLKNMIKEGRSKLEEALVKSLENEHKLIKYEHEMAQKLQTIAHLENTLKLRDGLIGVLKAKKEELTMENKSLNKYSEEIRSFVIEAKEELREKTEIITQLQSSLDNSRREILKYEHRLHEVENQLTLTNEKRYKLQDTVSQMERALQARSADDVELRYDHHHHHHHPQQAHHLHFLGSATTATTTASGRLSRETSSAEVEMSGEGDCECDCNCSCDCECEENPECPCEFYVRNPADDGDSYPSYVEQPPPPVGLQPWHVASAQLFNEYRSAYHSRKRRNAAGAVQSQSLGSISGRLSIGTQSAAVVTEEEDRSSTFNSMNNYEDRHMWPEHPSWQHLDECQADSNGSNGPQHHNHRRCHGTVHGASGVGLQDFDEGVPSVQYNPLNGPPENCVFGGGQQFNPVTFGRVDSYQVADAGHVVWLTPSATMQANNAIITRDLFAHSCSKIKTHLKNSLRRLNETRSMYC